MFRIISLKKENINVVVRITYYTCYIFFAIDRHDIAGILMKVALITINLTPLHLINVQMRRKALTLAIVCMSRYPSIISNWQLN